MRALLDTLHVGARLSTRVPLYTLLFVLYLGEPVPDSPKGYLEGLLEVVEGAADL